MAFLTLDRVALTTPDGSPLFQDLSFSLGAERVGLVGRNGSGKSSLLAAIAQGRAPVEGSINRAGKIAMLDQLPPDDAMPVPDALGISDEWARLARIERGEGSAEDFDAADWDLGARVESLLGDLGLSAAIMDRTIGTLSGGERTRVALARLLMDTPDVILLDEPTNNLDTDGRAAIVALLARWKGGALIASHDRVLLNMMDRIIELTPIGCRIYGGGWDAFASARAADRQRAEATLDRAAREVKAVRRDRQDALEKQAKRDRAGKAVAAKGSDPKILLGAQKRRAEATAGRVRSAGDADLAAAQDRQAQAQTAVEIVTPIRFTLPPSGLASQHMLVEARGISGAFGERHLFGPLDFTIGGPERIALTGPNGSGKTTLLRMLLGHQLPASGTIIADRTRMALLDQHMSMLDSEDGSTQTMLEAMMRLNPGMASHNAHAELAAAGFRGRWAERDTASLSGGERMRLALTCLFARAQPPQLLLLDEPTNHLDIEATELLEAALRDYDGALLCVSHDAAFRDAIALTRSIALG